MDIKSLLFNIDIKSGMPHPGSVLIAEPFLRDDYFSHAVICLVDYAPGKSSMGIVLNRQTAYTLQGLVSAVTIEEPVPVFCGGPMSCDRLYFLHTLGDIIPGSKEISTGLYIGGDFNAVTDYVNSGYPIEGRLRFFIGYSGWSERQLDSELRENVWAVTDLPPHYPLLDGAEDTYWHRWVKMLGPDFRGWRYHPMNPHVN